MQKLSNNPLANVGILGASILLSAYLYSRSYRRERQCKCTKRYYVEDVVIVTGSDDGIGLETAFLVAEKGARVILANANQQFSKLVKIQIKSRLYPKSADIVAIQCDFASFKSVRKFVHDVLLYLKNRPGCRITALVNTEEFYPTKRELTVDGFEKTFQINYLSPFLLIVLLLPTMSKYTERRVVCLSSSVIDSCHELDLEELNQYIGVSDARVIFDVNRAYQISKLCLALYISNLKIHGFEVGKHDAWQHSYCVDPGIVENEIFYKNYSLLPKKIKRSCVNRVNESCQGIMHALLSPPDHSFYIKGIDYVDKYLNPLFLEEIPKNMLYKKTCKWTNALDRIIIVGNGILPSIAIEKVRSEIKKSIEFPSPISCPTRNPAMEEYSMLTSTPTKVGKFRTKELCEIPTFIPEASTSTDNRATKSDGKYHTIPGNNKSSTTHTKDVINKSSISRLTYKPDAKASAISEPIKPILNFTKTVKDKSSTIPMTYSDKEASILEVSTSTENPVKSSTTSTIEGANKPTTLRYYYKAPFIRNTSRLTDKSAKDSAIPEPIKPISTSTETATDRCSTMIYSDNEPFIPEGSSPTNNPTTENPDGKRLTMSETDKLSTTPTEEGVSKSTSFRYYYKAPYIPNTTRITDKPTNCTTESTDIKHLTMPESDTLSTTPIEEGVSKSTTFRYYYKAPYITNTNRITDKPTNRTTESADIKHLTMPESDNLSTTPTEEGVSKSTTFRYYYKAPYITNTNRLTDKPTKDSAIPEPTKTILTSTGTVKDKSSTLINSDNEASLSEGSEGTDDRAIENPDVKHITMAETDKLSTTPTKEGASESTALRYYYKAPYIPNTNRLTDEPAKDSAIPEPIKPISTSTETVKSSTMIYSDEEPVDKPVAKDSGIPDSSICANLIEDCITKVAATEDTTRENTAVNPSSIPEAGIYDNLVRAEDSVEKNAATENIVADPSADANSGSKDHAIQDPILYDNVATTENDVTQDAAQEKTATEESDSAIEDSAIEDSATEDSAIESASGAEDSAAEESTVKESAAEDSASASVVTELPAANPSAGGKDHTTVKASICDNIATVEDEVAEDAAVETTSTDDPTSEDTAADPCTDANDSAPETLT